MYIIDKNTENEIIIKKSRFITKLYYIEDVNKVNDIIVQKICQKLFQI